MRAVHCSHACVTGPDMFSLYYWQLVPMHFHTCSLVVQQHSNQNHLEQIEGKRIPRQVLYLALGQFVNIYTAQTKFGFSNSLEGQW